MALTGAPSHWSETQKIRWKTDIPGRGFSSPVVWGDRIVVTSAVPTGAAPPQQEHRFEVFCLDRRTGKVLWQRTAKVAAPHEGHHQTYGAYLASENEDVVVVRLGEKCEVVATNTLTGQMFIATPAVAAGDLILRSQNRVYSIHEEGARSGARWRTA